MEEKNHQKTRYTDIVRDLEHREMELELLEMFIIQ